MHWRAGNSTTKPSSGGLLMHLVYLSHTKNASRWEEASSTVICCMSVQYSRHIEPQVTIDLR